MVELQFLLSYTPVLLLWMPVSVPVLRYVLFMQVLPPVQCSIVTWKLAAVTMLCTTAGLQGQQDQCR